MCSVREKKWERQREREGERKKEWEREKRLQQKDAFWDNQRIKWIIATSNPFIAEKMQTLFCQTNNKREQTNIYKAKALSCF